MTKMTQQMPLLMTIGNLGALTTEEVEQIKKYITLGTILDVQFKDGDGEVMIPTGFVPAGESVPAVVTLIKNGSILKKSVARTAYDFTSYEADKTTKKADGVVELTGQNVPIEDTEYTEVQVTESDVPEWVGMKFLVIATAEPGDELYKIYNEDGTDTGMWVKISVQS
jgi:hypothetical protein